MPMHGMSGHSPEDWDESQYGDSAYRYVCSSHPERLSVLSMASDSPRPRAVLTRGRFVLVQADKLDSQWRHGRSRPEPGRRLSKGLSWNAEEDDTR